MQRLLMTLTLFSAVTLTIALGCGDEGNTTALLSHAQSTLARESTPTIDHQTFTQQMQANNDFAFDLLRQVRKPDENLFTGPVSISSALAMAYGGARGATATEMKAALRFVLDDDTLHRAFNKLDLELSQRGASANEDFTLSLDNALWSQNDFELEADYLDLLALNYGAGMHLLDFIGNPEGSRTTINDWVAEKTEERIKDLIGPKQITEDTRLVLTNTIYFKASWVRYDAWPERLCALCPHRKLRRHRAALRWEPAGDVGGDAHERILREFHPRADEHHAQRHL
ncbi:MAG: hypothetical protein JRH20_20745 [Deltaproteobacteria bacterium]|nr:hypothetical protein [Deltaproteobacteria bacterium]